MNFAVNCWVWRGIFEIGGKSLSVTVNGAELWRFARIGRLLQTWNVNPNVNPNVNRYSNVCEGTRRWEDRGNKLRRDKKKVRCRAETKYWIRIHVKEESLRENTETVFEIQYSIKRRNTEEVECPSVEHLSQGRYNSFTCKTNIVWWLFICATKYQ